MYDRKETTEQAAARLGLPEQFTAMHEGYHVCIDGRHYRYSCLITDPDCDDIARGRLTRDGLIPCGPDALTYNEAIELAAKLYVGMRLAEMALTGDLGMDRVAPADRESHAAMTAELKAAQRRMQLITRQGRRPIMVRELRALVG